jgi:hypothetical protein
MAEIYIQFARKSCFCVSKRNGRMFQLYENDHFEPNSVLLSIFPLTLIDLLIVVIGGRPSYPEDSQEATNLTG